LPLFFNGGDESILEEQQSGDSIHFRVGSSIREVEKRTSF